MPKKTDPAEPAITLDRQNKPVIARDPSLRRGLRREDAAWYVGVSATKFADWVERRIMPEAIRIDGIAVWDRHKLDAAFDDLSNREDDSVWDDVHA